jgi:HemY protein
MLKLFLVTLSALIIAIIIYNLTASNSEIIINFADYEISTSISFILTISIFTVILIIILTNLIGKAGYNIRLYRIKRNSNKAQNAIKEISNSISLLTIGEIKQTKKSINKLQKILGNNPIVNILSAKLAMQTNDDVALQKSLNNMKEQEETQTLALSSLANLAQKNQNYSQAEKYLEEALKESPEATRLIPALIDIYKKNKQWQKLKTLIENNKKLLKTYDYQIDLAIASIVLSDLAMKGKDQNKALNLIKQAHKLIPQHHYLIIKYAQILTHKKSFSAATYIKKSWSKFSHPELVKLYCKIHSNKNIPTQLRKLENLIKINPQATSAHIQYAKIAILNEKHDQATIVLNQALNEHPHKEIYDLLIQIEQKQDFSNQEQIQKWEHARDNLHLVNYWICKTCNHNHDNWDALCKNCAEFNSLIWSEYSDRNIVTQMVKNTK